MRHAFNAKIAAQYGMVPALMLEHICYWVEHNRRKKQNHHNGRYWTYSTVESLAERYPYLGKKQITKAMQLLADRGLILREKHSDNRYNHTLWYTVTEYGYLSMEDAEGAEKPDKCDLSKRENRFSRKEKSNVLLGEIDAAVRGTSNAPLGEIEDALGAKSKKYSDTVSYTETDTSSYNNNEKAQKHAQEVVVVDEEENNLLSLFASEPPADCWQEDDDCYQLDYVLEQADSDLFDLDGMPDYGQLLEQMQQQEEMPLAAYRSAHPAPERPTAASEQQPALTASNLAAQQTAHPAVTYEPTVIYVGEWPTVSEQKERCDRLARRLFATYGHGRRTSPSQYDYRKVFHSVARPTDVDDLYIGVYDEDKAALLEKAFEIAAQNLPQGIHWGYIEGILCNWSRDGLSTREALSA